MYYNKSNDFEGRSGDVFAIITHGCSASKIVVAVIKNGSSCKVVSAVRTDDYDEVLRSIAAPVFEGIININIDANGRSYPESIKLEHSGMGDYLRLDVLNKVVFNDID